ncbi:MAG: hypothetical protein GTO37_07690 [Planctomycetales bacterium]|nr:hypothetical protein [Planctomycetales bacterium]
MFQKELDQLNDAMASFEIPKAYAKKSNEELNFLMLHYMFLMMDDAATSYEEGAFFPIELVSDAPQTAPRKTRPKATSPAPEKPADGGNGEATSADKQSAAEDRPAAPKS